MSGYLLLIGSVIPVTFFSGFVEVPRFLAFGLGLGLTMTATICNLPGPWYYNTPVNVHEKDFPYVIDSAFSVLRDL